VEGLGPIAAAAAAFLETHFLLSHPLRKPIVDTVGSAALIGIYSAVAAATLEWLALAYGAAPLRTRCGQRERTLSRSEGFAACPVASDAENTFNHPRTVVPRG
jgi:hypothetical protein